MIKGNKGEWSELYVLISLLADGKLYQSDFNLQKDYDNVYEVIKAYKAESDYNLEFDRNNNVTIHKIKDGVKSVVRTFSLEELKIASEKIYEGIVKGKGKSFAIMEMNDFFANSSIQKIKADSNVKADIRLKIYDHRLAKETNLGFSIKSLIGGQSTLFNTGPGNNFIYSVENKLEESVANFNLRTYKPEDNRSKITYRLQELEKTKAEITFKDIQSNQLWKNLKMIDGDLPDILSYALYYRYLYRQPALEKIAKFLEEKDPLNFYRGEANEQKLYEYKLKRFLTEAAMGMTSEKPWLGEYDSFGGVIVAKSDGDIVCFHIYDFNLFRNYLLRDTKFEQASTGEDELNPGNINPSPKSKKYHFGWLYEEENELNIKINLQVRFK